MGKGAQRKCRGSEAGAASCQIFQGNHVRLMVWTTIAMSMLLLPGASGMKQCSEREGSGVCPDFNTCCPTIPSGRWDAWSACITGRSGKEDGVCCGDGGPEYLASHNLLSGCGPQYQCARDNDGRDYYYCEGLWKNGSLPYPSVLPRYPLCELPAQSLKTLFRFPMATHYVNNDEKDDDTVFATYMTHTGRPLPLSPDNKRDHVEKDSNKDKSSAKEEYDSIRRVVIMVHGSSRDADDYLCSTWSAWQLSMTTDAKDDRTTLLIAPRFLGPDDDDVGGVTDPAAKVLRWNITWPLVHTWRYGANDMHYNISSFHVMDRLLEHIVTVLPRLQQVVVAGHSAGGQFVHRWALLSNSWIWQKDSIARQTKRPASTAMARRRTESTNGALDEQLTENKSFEHSAKQSPANPAYNHDEASWLPQHKRKNPSIRVVPANPRCFCYLDARRWVLVNETTRVFQTPSANDTETCPRYNQWIWGLQHGSEPENDPLDIPYKQRALQELGYNLTALRSRYLQERQVIYLQGQMDLENPDGDIPGAWCEDDWQGPNRYERGRWFYKSLSFFDANHIHQHYGVAGVAHDHTLIFTSPVGVRALFGPPFQNLMNI